MEALGMEALPSRQEMLHGLGTFTPVPRPSTSSPLHPSMVEVDAGWALGVAGLAILIIFALCVIAKCNLSRFTRYASFYCI
jgi:hypothetical protein